MMQSIVLETWKNLTSDMEKCNGMVIQFVIP